jgi:PBP1b-binding outer membrane lipoprotein LpoB
MKPTFFPAAVLAVSFVWMGCSADPNVRYVDPNAQGQIAGTGLESQDVNAAAQKAAESIVNLRPIAKASRPPVIIVTPVTNKSSSPIDTSLFTSILRDNLMANSGGKVRFIERDTAQMSKEEQELINSGEVVSTRGKRAPLSFDYILTAELQGISMAGGGGQSDYFRIAFKLKDPRTDLLLWTDVYQVKKEGKESAVYR